MSKQTLNRVGRAGKYLPQPTGYRAFFPASLPPEPEIQLDKDLQVLLSQADRALGRLDGSILTLPNADLFVYMYVRKEAVLSSQIEGTQSSLQDLLAAEAKILNPDRPKDVDEVVNYVAAMNHGLKRLPEMPISVRLIKEIHARLLEGVRGTHLTPGEIRRSQNWIVFFLRGVTEVGEQATQTARNILNLRETHRAIITERLGRVAANGLRVLENLYEHPIVTVNKIQQLVGTTYQAANDLVARLVDHGILVEVTGKARNRQFIYLDFTNLFNEQLGTENS